MELTGSSPSGFVEPNVSALTKAAELLRAGELIVVPTDTVYGICADAFCRKAIEKIFQIKKRSRQKPVAILVRDFAQAATLATFNQTEKDLAENYWPGALTIVCEKREEIPNFFGNSDGTLALRCPEEQFIRKLADLVGPLAVTSANISGEATPEKPHKLAKSILDSVALVVDDGPRKSPSSTVLKVGQNGELEQLRQGKLKDFSKIFQDKTEIN